MKKRELTTTSYAVLGWLNVRPWPIYELAKQTRRNLRFFWPRADSRLYDEAKTLVVHGLARAERELIGKRPRTTYSITARGRSELQRWMRRPTAAPVLELESLAKVFFAESARPDDLWEALAAAEGLADEIQRAGRVVAEEFLDGTHEFPERIQLSGLVFDFLWSWADLLRDWSKRSRREISTWNDTAWSERKAAHARSILRRATRSE